MNDVIGGLYRLLGWYSSANNILPETITIETVVPKPKKTKKGREEDSEIIERIACDYLNFLQSRGVKPRTLLCSIKPIHYLIRYQYRDCTKDARYKDIPAMVAIQQRMNEIDRVLRKQTKPSSDSDMKWLDLPQVITQIVEPLRKECAAHTCCGAKRSVSAIAKSFQRYVAWGLMCYRPPRRQGEFRQAKIWANAYCDLETGQLIQPLPPAHLRDRCHSYFHKRANGFWYLDVPREASKTGDTFGDQDLIIENIQFPDGKTFYDYIEGFLYGVCIDSKGNWNAHSLFQGKHLDLRMEFNPKCDNFFVYPHNGGAYDRTSFMLIFKETAHRLTGKPINPHLLRDIYATWYLDNGHTPERITSLAYAMAHSEKTLREIYDRRHSQDKNRPIEEAHRELIQELLNDMYKTS
jgi:hypothetical protein